LRPGRCAIDTIEQSTDEELLVCVSGDQQKLAILREAVRINRERLGEHNGTSPILPPYEA
jgi:K+-sensing histidine kinase KdpD